MLHCTVLDDYQGVALTSADWTPLAGRVEVSVMREHLPDEAELAARLAGSQIVVIMRERTPFRRSLFERLPELRLLVTSGMRNAAVDLTAAADHRVAVCGTETSSQPPAELTWALLLGLARNLVPESTAVREDGPWQSTVGTDLVGATLGLLGLGRIGGQVARVGLAFGMAVQAWSQNLSAERAAGAGVRLAPSKEELFATSDFVSIHLLLSERTRGLVDRATLDRMPLHAFLINTSRAGIVDQDALLDTLRSGRIAGAGLDVFDVEPLPPHHPLRTLPNVLATPHLGYVSKRNYATFFSQGVEDIEAFLAGAPIRRL